MAVIVPEIFAKGVTEVRPFTFDWTAALPTGVTISTFAFVVPAGLTKDSENGSGLLTQVWLSGGIVGTSYDILATITTSDSQTRTALGTIEVI